MVENNEQANYCLKQVLKIQPDNQQTKERLNRLNVLEDFQAGQPEQPFPKQTPAQITPLQKRLLQTSKQPKKAKVTNSLFFRLGALLVIAIGFVICLIAVFFTYRFSKTTSTLSNRPASATPVVISGGNPTGFIKSISEFEESQFCKQYQCILASQMNISNGLDNAYLIGQYPVYNEFLIEIITENDKITVFGMTLDPRTG